MLQLDRIIEILTSLYKIRFRKENPFYLLIGVLLSQRAKDEVSWPTSNRLFSKAKNLDGMLELSKKQIEKIIYPVGFYRQKARRIKQICKILKEKYQGKVPETKEELMQLPGIGLKSTNIVLSYGYGHPVISVDVHVAVISRRWHLTKEEKPEKISEELNRKIPIKYRLIFNDLLVQFGKEYCRTRLPRCRICPVFKLCPYEDKNV